MFVIVRTARKCKVPCTNWLRRVTGKYDVDDCYAPALFA